MGQVPTPQVDIQAQVGRNARMRGFTIVVAADAELGIGRAGALPWRLKQDMKHFRELTTGNGKSQVIMGRKTWESIPERFRPLPDRLNTVLSRSTDYYVPGQLSVSEDHQTQAATKVTKSSLSEALCAYEGGPCFVIGGGAVYAEAVNHQACTDIIITRVSRTFECDVFFPRFDDQYRLDSTIGRFSESGIDCSIERWVRN